MAPLLATFKVKFKLFHWILIVLLIGGGFLLGSLVSQWQDDGYFSSWSKLPTPEKGNFSLVGATWGGIFVRSDDGTVWLCDRISPQCTLSDFEQIYRDIIREECDFNEPAFSAFVKPPQGIKGCIREIVLAADSATDTVAVIDSENQLWFWTNFHTGFLPNFRRYFVTGFFTVTVVGTGIFLLWLSLLVQKWFFYSDSPR